MIQFQPCRGTPTVLTPLWCHAIACGRESNSWEEPLGHAKKYMDAVISKIFTSHAEKHRTYVSFLRITSHIGKYALPFTILIVIQYFSGSASGPFTLPADIVCDKSLRIYTTKCIITRVCVCLNMQSCCAIIPILGYYSGYFYINTSGILGVWVGWWFPTAKSWIRGSARALQSHDWLYGWAPFQDPGVYIPTHNLQLNEYINRKILTLNSVRLVVFPNDKAEFVF